MKKKNASITLLVVIVGVMSGCASFTPATKVSVDKSRVMKVDFDTAWERVIEWYAERTINIEAMEKDSGLITAEAARYEDGLMYADCGKGSGHMLNPTLEFNTHVTRKPDDHVKVNMTVSANTIIQSKDMYGRVTGERQVNCYSNGKLEQELLNHVQTGQ